jgi:hypothetical protein
MGGPLQAKVRTLSNRPMQVGGTLRASMGE